MFKFSVTLFLNLSLPKNDESIPFFVNSIGIIFVLGHKSLTSCNLFSNALNQASSLKSETLIAHCNEIYVNSNSSNNLETKFWLKVTI